MNTFFFTLLIYFFHHTTCESKYNTLASSAANQGDNTVSVAQVINLRVPKDGLLNSFPEYYFWNNLIEYFFFFTLLIVSNNSPKCLCLGKKSSKTLEEYNFVKTYLKLSSSQTKPTTFSAVNNCGHLFLKYMFNKICRIIFDIYIAVSWVCAPYMLNMSINLAAG